MKQQLKQRQQQQQEVKKLFELEQQQISENRKTLSDARGAKGSTRQKKVQYEKIGTSGESRKCSNDPGKFGIEFGMQMIEDRFGDGWHKSIGKFFGVQQIATLFGDAVT